MSIKDIASKGNAASALCGNPVEDPPLLGRKSVLMGMLTSGFVIANAAQPSAVAAGTTKPPPISATQPAYIPKWTPATPFVRGQQIISPNNDVVAANAAHTSSTTYATDTPKWTLSSTYAQRPDNRAKAVGQGELLLNVKDFGALGNGVTNDSTAIQSALNALPSSAGGGATGGTIFFPAGIYRVATTLTSSLRGLRLAGSGGVMFNESEDQSSGSTLLGDAGVTIFAFNDASANLVHQGPKLVDLNFRESGEAKTATLVIIGTANRWAVRDCSFRGGLIGLDVDAGTPAQDVSWGVVDHGIFSACGTGLRFPSGTGTSLISGGEFTNCGTGIYCDPKGSLSSEFTVVGAKFDAATIAGIHTKGRNMRVFGCGFERCAVGVKIERDAALHADSGKLNNVMSCLFTGSGTETGVSIGLGVQNTTVFSEFSTLATRIANAGTGTVMLDSLGGLSIDRDANTAPHQKFRVNNTDLGEFFSDSASVLMLRLVTTAAKMRFRLGGTTSADEFAVQNSAGTNLLRVFGAGDVQQVSASSAFTINGALKHSGTTVGLYGATPVAKAANPGVATGPDATVLNAVVTALRNLGVVA